MPKQKKDLRSPVVKARDAFLESKGGQDCCKGTASGEYLKNRIVIAFLAGMNWREWLATVDLEAATKAGGA